MCDRRFAVSRAASLIACLGLCVSTATEAAYTTTVLGTAEPWQFVSGGLNTNYRYGGTDGTAPTVVGASSGISFAAGGTLTIAYVSGTVAAGNGYPATDAKGDTGIITNGGIGNSGGVFPSYYFDRATYPAYLDELVGTFTNGSGAIVGTPFAVGDYVSLIVPAGATQLQLGVNDDIFRDNTGSWTVVINGASAIPEPASVLMLGIGLAGVAWRGASAEAG